MIDQRLAATEREQTRLVSELFLNFLQEFRVILGAHNGLIVGSRPSAFGSVKAVVPAQARHCPELTALFGAGSMIKAKSFTFGLIQPMSLSMPEISAAELVFYNRCC
jgi:hypothetical protein